MTTRRFRHCEGFEDGIDYVEFTGTSQNSGVLVYADGTRKPTSHWRLLDATHLVQQGIWKEVAPL